MFGTPRTPIDPLTPSAGHRTPSSGHTGGMRSMPLSAPITSKKRIERRTAQVRELEEHLRKGGVAYAFGAARAIVDQEYESVEDLLRLGDDQLVQLLSLAGIKHKSIVTFTHYANGLRSHAAHTTSSATATATISAGVASVQGHHRRSNLAGSNPPRSSSPLPHASGPYAPGTSNTSVGGAASRHSSPTVPTPLPHGRAPRFEGGTLHQLSSSMEAMSGLTGGGNLSPGASVHAFEKQFAGAGNASTSATTRTTNYGRGGGDEASEPPFQEGEDATPRAPFLRPPPPPGNGLGGSARGSPSSGGVVLAGEPSNRTSSSFAGPLPAGLPGNSGSSELPFDVFADVTKSLNVLMLHAKKSYDDAEDEYRAALRANESFEWAHNNLGLMLMNVRGDYDGAEKEFRRAIDLDPTYTWARNNLGLLLYEVRQEPAAAEAEFRRCLELDPRHAEAHCNLATLLDNKAERIEETGTDLATAASIYMEAADHWEVRHGKHNNYSRAARGKAAHLMGMAKSSG